MRIILHYVHVLVAFGILRVLKYMETYCRNHLLGIGNIILLSSNYKGLNIKISPMYLPSGTFPGTSCWYKSKSNRTGDPVKAIMQVKVIEAIPFKKLLGVSDAHF